MTGLQAFRAKHRLKGVEMARAADISESAISQILSGAVNPSKETIDKLLAFCRTFDPDVTYDDLFGAEAA